MYFFLKNVHSYWAYLAIIAIAVSTIYFLLSFRKKRSFSSKDKKLAMLTMTVIHVQFLLGLVLYFVSPRVQLGLEDMAATMKDSELRFYVIEHISVMLLSVILVTIGYSKAKRAATDLKKFKLLYVFYGIGMFLLLSRIPWGEWVGAIV